MQLDVPMIIQKEDQRYGLAAVEMVLTYYGADVTPLENFLNEREGGTDMAQIGRAFLTYGFETEIITCHPRLFDMHDHSLSQEEIYAHIEKMTQFDLKRTHDRITLENLLTYFDEGGKITVKAPSFDLVKKELDAGRPAIGNVTTNFTFRGQPLRNSHFVVFTGYKGGKLILNDPNVTHTQGTLGPKNVYSGHEKIKGQWIFGGLYADQLNETIDEGSILLIRKKDTIV